MDYSFVYRIYEGSTFLGTAFFINETTLYTAAHCVENVEDSSKCYITLKTMDTKYDVQNICYIKELDFAEITIKEGVQLKFPRISIDYINTKEDLEGYGFKEEQEAVGVLMKLEDYTEIDNEAAEFIFMVKNEEDSVRWNGVSGGPVVIAGNVCGVILRNIGGDGIKTRLKVISFNKIVKYFVRTNRFNMLEKVPENNLAAQLKKQMDENSMVCEQLHYCSNYQHTQEHVDIRVNFVKLNQCNQIDEGWYLSAIRDLITKYAVSLDERYAQKDFLSIDEMNKLFKRITEITEKMKLNYNSAYILLWIFSEGILKIPRVGRVLIKDGREYYEEDVYLKVGEECITVVIPVISVYEELFDAIRNILLSIRDKALNTKVKANRIDWDRKAIECLDYKTQVDISDLIKGRYSKGLNIEITGLVVHNSEVYTNIPTSIDSEKRLKEFFYEEFREVFEDADEDYRGIAQQANEIGIKLNIFILPLLDVKLIESI